MRRPWRILLGGGWRRGNGGLFVIPSVFSSARRRRRGFSARPNPPLGKQSCMRATSVEEHCASPSLEASVLQHAGNRGEQLSRRHLNIVALASPQRSRSALYCSRQDLHRARCSETHHSPRTRQNKLPHKTAQSHHKTTMADKWRVPQRLSIDPIARAKDRDARKTARRTNTEDHFAPPR